MSEEISKSIDELLGVMSDVAGSYAVWRELTDIRNREIYEPIKRRYSEFFDTIDRSNFALVINGLYILLENKKNTESLRSAIRRQRKLGRLYESKCDQWLSIIDGWEGTSKKIAIIRSNIFAHRGLKLRSQDFARKAAITPDEIGTIVSQVEALLKEFSELTQINTVVLPASGNVKAHTQELMGALSVSEA